MPDATTPLLDPANLGQAQEWDGEHGAYWAREADAYDAALARYQPALLAAVAARPGERVLDVGCGSGRLTLDLARETPGVMATGVDLSAAQLAVARNRAGDLPVTFLQADAQVHPFGSGMFDVVTSRTGTMFFGDPGAAFANLCRATREGGRLVMLVWRDLADNPWLQELFGAIVRVRPMPTPPPRAPGPFALSDPQRVRSLLDSSGWVEVTLTTVDEEVCLGPDPDRATSFIVGQMARQLGTLGDGEREQAVANLRAVMASHARDGGVWLGSGAWLVAARRRAVDQPGQARETRDASAT